jgi:hypothetical protein
MRRLSNSVLELIFTSQDCVIQDEDSLFRLILQLIDSNPNRNTLLKTLKFEFISSD